MKSFQVDTKTVEIRNALLDLAERNGWRTGERRYYANGILWLVVLPHCQNVGGNLTANDCQQKSIKYAIDVLSKPPVKPICKIGVYEVCPRRTGCG